MFTKNCLFLFLLLRFIAAIPQINLYYTDAVENSDQVLQHDCLRVSADKEAKNERQVVYYCMNDLLPTNNNIEDNNFSTKLTFEDLAKQNIASDQLFFWSIPIDIIERYEIYLTKDVSLGKEMIYNCTWPRFGPQCQYDLPYYHDSNLSLAAMIASFRYTVDYKQTKFTCYIHLECDRGTTTTTVCLDWSEICDGKIHCLNNGLDEKDCWKLEVNECENDEFRCLNGQCIPKIFYRDQSSIDDCMDGSDERNIYRTTDTYPCYNEQPSFGLDDIVCKLGPFTSSCVKSRSIAIMESIYLNKNYFQSENCWLAYKHLWGFADSTKFCEGNTCKDIIDKECADMIYFPSAIGLNDIYFGFNKTTLNTIDYDSFYQKQFYICSNNVSYDRHFYFTNRFPILNNMTCFDFHFYCIKNGGWGFGFIYWHCFRLLVHDLGRFYTNSDYTDEMCNRTNMYQCENSEKCISLYRLHDGPADCPDEDDRTIDASNSHHIMEYFQKYYFQCQTPNNTFIHLNYYRDGYCNCKEIEYELCDDEIIPVKYLKRNITFQHICDGFEDIKPIVIDGRSETDETECENWPCVNFNTYCDGTWNCPKGADEVACNSSTILNCSENSHLCFSPTTYEFICVPIEKVNDGYADCVGGTDEHFRCLREGFTDGFQNQFSCFRLNTDHCVMNMFLCDGEQNCPNGDDEKFCASNKSLNDISDCSHQYKGNYSNFWKFMCDHIAMKGLRTKQFTLDGINHLTTNEFSTKSKYVQHQPDCHRGLFVRIWSNNSTTNTCLCPPAYYGDRCQYQNQRISLALKFHASSDSLQTPFVILILLIDNSEQRLIHTYEQLTYLAIYDCNIKFNVYLYYATRPKDRTKTYSIHIDIYEKLSLNYRGSFYFPIEFSFLPVHRLAYIINIPHKNDKILTCSKTQCIHGKCIYYLNRNLMLHYCQCDPNWTGQNCSIPYQCTCSSNSKCVGISSDNRSICICSVDKFGSQCYINTDCQDKCQNNGQCIPSDDFLMFNRTYRCVCKDGFTGEQCEITNTKLNISFDKLIDVSQSIYIHFIQIFNSTIEPLRSTTYRTAVIRPDSIIIYWSQPFHLVFIQPTLSTYYLVLLQRIYQQSKQINKLITSTDRCLHINEIFNQTFLQWHLIRRIKYYHLPCQTYPRNLSCFYDDTHLCICASLKQQRIANCLKFQHNITMNCSGSDQCLNGGHCFQDKPTCPNKFVCHCPLCYYGRLCQFNTNTIGLSLDTILGYHILPEIHLTKQPMITQISFAFSIIFFLIGLLDGILSLITFCNKNIYEVGCGFYLIGSSISTLFTMTLFQLKFVILILTQMKLISNHLFLLIQCQSLDYLLRFSLHMDQWLNASISTERTYTILQGVHFDRKKSQKIARIVIIFLIIFNATTIVHDPIYRELVYEGNDSDEIQRIWCVNKYSSKVHNYNYVINLIHFVCPFLFNVLSVIILIRKKSQQQFKVHKHLHFQVVLLQQFQEHKHILIAPIVSILLALPRLVITFVTKCIKSPNDIWLPLLGYFISFIPPMLTFIIFVIPSKFYRKELTKTIKQYRTNLRRRFNWLS